VADYSSGLRVIDVSTPTNPNEVGYYDTPGDAEGVFCSGGYIFVADGMGLQILELTDPAGVDEIPGTIPTVCSLLPAYPNPLNPQTTISFDLTAAVAVRLTVYSAAGRQVAILDEGVREPGRHAVAWDGRDFTGRTLPGGVYFARLDAGDFHASQRMMLVK
jgi:hypothetical protein